MAGIRLPKDDEEQARFDEAVRRGLGVPLEIYVESVIGRTPDADTVEVIREWIECHGELFAQSTELDIREAILHHLRWLEISS